MKKCPKCSSRKTTKHGFVVSSGGIKQRRRKCQKCGHVFKVDAEDEAT